MLPSALFEDMFSNNRTNSTSDNKSYDCTPNDCTTFRFFDVLHSLGKWPHGHMIPHSIVALDLTLLHAACMKFVAKNRCVDLRHATSIIGVLNRTEDSYVATSRVAHLDSVLALAQQYIDEGADILEIGGESTGPSSVDISASDERERVVPAVTVMRKKFPDVIISVDTYKADVARAALLAGADMINDITAGRGDDRMLSVVASAGCPVVLMYAKDSSARTTISDMRYNDVIQTISEFLAQRLETARSAGIKHIIIDPGLGHFVSSDSAYSWEILARLSELTSLGPVLVSPSRKSFLAGPSDLPVAERLPATLAASCLASLQGASFIRTHDVRATHQALDAIATMLPQKSSLSLQRLGK